MKSYASESHIVRNSNAHYTQSDLAVALQRKGRALFQDTITCGRQSKIDSSGTNMLATIDCSGTNMLATLARATLPSPTTTVVNDALDVLAGALVKAYSAMNHGAITQNLDYASLQQLDQVQAQAVLQSTVNAIHQQEAAASINSQIQGYQNQEDDTNTAGTVLFWVGIGLMVLTVISGFFDFGASDAALAPEAEALGDVELGDMAGDATEASDADTTDVDSSDDTDTDSTDDVDDSSDVDDTDVDSDGETTEENSESTTKDSEASNETAAQTKARFWKVFKFVVKMAVGAGFASPMLVMGILKLQLSDTYHQLAQTQLDIGTAMSGLERNDMYFRFLQQLTQREGSVTEDGITRASEVVGTFASIMSTYGRIPVALANAV